LILYSFKISSIPDVNLSYHFISLIFEDNPIEINDGNAPIAARSLNATATDLYAISSGDESSGK